MRIEKIGCGSSTCHGHGDYAVCGEYYWDSIYICKSCEYKQIHSERDTYRELCAELVQALSEISGLTDSPKAYKIACSAITKAEAILGDKT